MPKGSYQNFLQPSRDDPFRERERERERVGGGGTKILVVGAIFIFNKAHMLFFRLSRGQIH